MYRYLLSLSMATLILTPALAQTAGETSNNIAETTGMQPARTTEQTTPLSLRDALTLAFGANAELSVARHEIDAVEATLQQAGTRPNPEVSVLVEDTRRETRTTTLQLNQVIEFGGKRDARIDAATRARDGATADLNAKRADIRAAVITAFFEVLNAQERLLLADASVDLAQRGTNVAARRVTAGKVSPVEETKARVAQANSQLERIQAKSELASARKRLAATWGNPVARFEHAEGQFETLPEIPAWTDLATRLRAAPAITRARLEVDRRQALARLESSRRISDVTLSVGFKRSEELGRNQAIVGLSMPLPFFDRNQGNVAEALRPIVADNSELEKKVVDP